MSKNNLLEGWELIPFTQVLKKSDNKIQKIKKSEYQDVGKYPIIDQGKELIAGYTEKDGLIYQGDLPVVIFGDHTRIFKFIDFPFVIGADGTKVLSPNRDFDPKFFYYSLLNLNIEDRGYSRHYRYLKEKKIPLPPLETQRKIVEILERADAVRRKRQEADKKTAQILQAAFVKMFGDPVRNEKAYNMIKLGDVCTINPRKSEISGLERDTEVTFLPMESVSEEGTIIAHETKQLSDVVKGYTYFREGDVLLAKITPCMENGKRAIAKGLKNAIGFGSTEFHVIRGKENTSTEWVYGLISLTWFRGIAAINMTGTAGQKRVPADFLKNLMVPLPHLENQKKYSEFVKNIEAMKERQTESNTQINEMFQGLMQKAFRGELVA